MPFDSGCREGGRGPLAGLRVVEIAGIGPGPYAAMMLADLGAEVLRIDRPGSSPSATADPTLRNRKVLRLDLKRLDGVEILLRAVDRADVLLEGFRPGVAERLGFGPDVCLQRNSRLVFGRITGWGQSGPLARTAGHDINYIALTGLLHQVGEPGGKPVPPMNVVGDYGGGGLLLAYGVLAALFERQTSGLGQVVDAAMIDGAASFMAATFALREAGCWRDAPGKNFLTGAAHYYDTYETSDSRWVAIGSIEPQFHAQMLERLGLDPGEFASAQGFDADGYDRLVDEIWPVMKRRVAAAVARHTRDELAELFAGTDACVTPVLSLDEAAAHPHNRARRTFVEIDGVTQNAPAPRFSRSVPDAPRPPSREPSQTEAVLAELGYDTAAIETLRRDGAFHG
ncbi:MAG: CoA transferase [Ectothiorhodospiraceae bacterium]|nr:CoA transferase [Ectothiorhodospiraceae bacterium]TVQ46836.1 MAG: CoA transferase [Gammaproteobacteria bacterium]